MKRIAAMVLLVAVVGCKKKEGKKVDDASPPAPVADAADTGDAAAAGDPDLPDENSVRAGKRTGMEAPDSKPEVATEPLVRALLGGQTPWTRFVDAATGAVVMRSLPPPNDTAPAVSEVGRRCAAALDEAFTGFATSANAALADGAMLYDIICDNTGLAVTIPGVSSHAVCTVSSASGGGVDHDLVFVPDPARGLRLIGIGISDGSYTGDALLDQFDEEMGRFGARCP